MRRKPCQEVKRFGRVSGPVFRLWRIIFLPARPPPKCSRQDLPELRRAIHAENPPLVAEYSLLPPPPALAAYPDRCPSREVQRRCRVFLQLVAARTVDDGHRYGRRAT